MKKWLLYLLLIMMVSYLGCNEDGTLITPNDASPKIDTLAATPDTIQIGTETTLNCAASDADKDSLTILWKSSSGSFPHGQLGASVKWKAPDTAGIYKIIVTVMDSKNVVSDTVIVTALYIETPVQLAPVNGAVDVALPVTFEWNAPNGASSYTLQVSTDSLFTSLIFNQSSLTGTTQQVTSFNYLTKYYWRVSAANSYGISSWSSVYNFETIAGIFTCGESTVYYLGKIYNTVLIGSQCWLKENLNVGTRVNGNLNQTDNSAIEKYCYKNNEANCDTFGGLYQWNEAMQYSKVPGTRGICPPGWHIPTEAEFQTLAAAVSNDANALRAIGQGSGGGQGTNTSGFSALLAGGTALATGGFFSLSYTAFFWSSTEYSSVYARDIYLFYANADIAFGSTLKENGFSARCVKD